MIGEGEAKSAGDRDALEEEPGRVRGPLAIDPGVLLGEAWAIFSAAWPACLVIYWGAFAAWWLLINLLVIVLASFNVAIGDPTVTPVLEFLRFVGILLVPAWLWLGQGIAFLKIARREPVALDDLFRGGRSLLTVLLAAGVFLAVAAVPCLAIYGITEAAVAIVGGDSVLAMARRVLPAGAPENIAEVEGQLLVAIGLTAIFAALSFASFFAVRVRLRPFPQLILDRDLGVLESLRTARRLTYGRAGALFVVHLAQFTINLAGLMLCCVGLLVSLPLTRLISAVTYNALSADLSPLEIPEEDEETD